MPAPDSTSLAWCRLPCPCPGSRAPWSGCGRSRVSAPKGPATRHPCRTGCCRSPLPCGQPPGPARCPPGATPWWRSSSARTASSTSLRPEIKWGTCPLMNPTYSPLSSLPLVHHAFPVNKWTSMSGNDDLLLMFMSVHSWILLGSWCCRCMEAARKTRSNNGVS